MAKINSYQQFFDRLETIKDEHLHHTLSYRYLDLILEIPILDETNDEGYTFNAWSNYFPLDYLLEVLGKVENFFDDEATSFADIENTVIDFLKKVIASQSRFAYLKDDLVKRIETQVRSHEKEQERIRFEMNVEYVRSEAERVKKLGEASDSHKQDLEDLSKEFKDKSFKKKVDDISVYAKKISTKRIIEVAVWMIVIMAVFVLSALAYFEYKPEDVTPFLTGLGILTAISVRQLTMANRSKSSYDEFRTKILTTEHLKRALSDGKAVFDEGDAKEIYKHLLSSPIDNSASSAIDRVFKQQKNINKKTEGE